MSPQSTSWLFGATLAHELLEALIASVDDAIYMVDPDGRVRFLNPAALRILGYDRPDELIGRISHETIHYQHRDGTHFPAEECPMLRPRTTGETVREELDWFTRKDGRMVPVAYSSAPLATDQGRGAVVVFRDVSERLASEESRRREAEERARAEELQASRARIVTAMDAERRRLGRDLHDGAQQRLLHALLLLQDGRHADEDPAVREAARAVAVREIRACIEDLRELAAGIHPAILSNRGLSAAVESVTARVPIPVDLVIPDRRFPEPVEVAAYFTVTEALANVVKHAMAIGVDGDAAAAGPAALDGVVPPAITTTDGAVVSASADGAASSTIDASASHARVEVVASPGTMRLVVSDDGPGGATLVAGHGLGGLQDRISALGGTFEVDSPPGAGTRVIVELPIAG
ncbi:MAG: PAS domain S-box protein [Solirubrobacteraceae bacterium]|nr:PAS domain S-box protein [Solirubrobacteraceae bacterium]